MRMLSLKALSFLLLLLVLFGLPACEKQGPLERAGERADETIDDAGDKVEEIQEDIERQN